MGATALDATIVRPPMSGVHYAVRNQVRALLELPGESPWVCFATDLPCRVAAAACARATAPALPDSLCRVSRRVLWQQLQLPGALHRNRCDLLFSLAYTAPLFPRTRYLLQVFDLIGLLRSAMCSTLNAYHMRWLMPESIRNAHQILVPSNRVADDIRALFGSTVGDRCVIVPLGIDPIYLEPAPELPSELSSMSPFILFVGNIEPKKGLDVLLQAYRQAARETNASLVLAGRVGWKSKTLVHELDSYQGPGRIFRMGYVDQAVLPALYAEAAACVMPSYEEGFGLPVLEAMAMGTPVIHSDHPVLNQTAATHGIKFPVADAHALAERLIEVTRGRCAVDEGRRYARGCTWGKWARTVQSATGVF